MDRAAEERDALQNTESEITAGGLDAEQAVQQHRRSDDETPTNGSEGIREAADTGHGGANEGNTGEGDTMKGKDANGDADEEIYTDTDETRTDTDEIYTDTDEICTDTYDGICTDADEETYTDADEETYTDTEEETNSDTNADADEAGTGESADEVPPAEEFFHVKYNNVLKAYSIAPLTKEFPRWQSLCPVEACKLKTKWVHVGDYVVIYLQGNQEVDAAQDYAKVREIRVLSKTAWLIRVAWLYQTEKGWHESNHYMISLWDTVNEIVRRPDELPVISNSLFDACCTNNLCNLEKIRWWQSKENSMFSYEG